MTLLDAIDLKQIKFFASYSAEEAQLISLMEESRRRREKISRGEAQSLMVDALARLLYYQELGSPNVMRMTEAERRKEFDELPERIVAHFRNDVRFNCAVARAVNTVWDIFARMERDK